MIFLLHNSGRLRHFHLKVRNLLERIETEMNEKKVAINESPSKSSRVSISKSKGLGISRRGLAIFLRDVET